MSECTLRDEGLVGYQPKEIVGVELYLHQRMALYKMEEIENTVCFNFEGEHSKYDCNDGLVDFSSIFSCLCDQPGTGKSLTMLSRIASQVMLFPKEYKNSTFTGQMFSYSCKNNLMFNHYKDKIHVRANLIVIPHSLTSQWCSYVSNYTTLTFYSIFEKEHLKNLNLLDMYSNYDIVLLSSEMYKEISFSFENVLFSRCCVDEADTTRIHGLNGIKPYAVHYWLITASYTNLFAESRVRQLYKLIFKDFRINNTFKNAIVVINSKEVVEKSIKLPKPITQTFIVKDPNFLVKISPFLDRKTIELINSGNMDEALESLNIGQETITDIVDMLSSNLQIQLTNLNNELKYVENKVYANKNDKKKTIETINKNILEMETKIQDLTARINSSNDCPICFEFLTNPFITKCCACKYCFTCFQKTIDNCGKCPSCRAEISLSSLINITNSSKKEIDNRDKIDVFIDIINSLSNKDKIIVFSREYSFSNTIKDRIKHTNYLVLEDQNSKQRNNNINIVQNFKNSNKKSVLFLCSKTYSTGLNLEFATHLIKLDKVDKETNSQIEGRILRPGLTHQPKFISILYQNEA